MPKCSYKFCKNITSRTLKKDGISYFRFPRDPVQCQKWTSLVSRQRGEDFFKPTTSSVVCSKHFAEKDMYVTDKGIMRLLKTAVPNVPLPENDTAVTTSVIDVACIETDGQCTTIKLPLDLEPALPVVAGKNKKLKSPSNSLSLGSILEIPKNVGIERELKKVRERLIKRNKDMNNLRKKNNRLKKRNAFLKNALNELKKKFRVYQVRFKLMSRFNKEFKSNQ